MCKKICRWWFNYSGWKVVNHIPKKNHASDIQKYVIVAAPHTSNWDFVIGMGALDALKLPIRFTIKKEWIFFPVGGIFKKLGAIPIDRNPKPGTKTKSMVDEMVDILNSATEDMAILVTPEATRSHRKKWRTGFYHVAKNAGVPILLGYLDYAKKECGVKEIMIPGDDMDTDMRQIMAYYQTITPKHPDLFSVDVNYL